MKLGNFAGARHGPRPRAWRVFVRGSSASASVPMLWFDGVWRCCSMAWGLKSDFTEIGCKRRAPWPRACRGAQRPASIHLGEETGGPHKLWRAQLPSLVKAFRGRRSRRSRAARRSTTAGYVLLRALLSRRRNVRCRRRCRYRSRARRVQLEGLVGACDDPDETASRACGARRARRRRRSTTCAPWQCAGCKDALWNHRRPVSAEVTLGDGSTTTVVVEAGEDPTAVVAAACRERTSPRRLCHSVSPARRPFLLSVMRRQIAGDTCEGARGARSRRSPSPKPGPSLLLRRSPARTRASRPCTCCRHQRCRWRRSHPRAYRVGFTRPTGDFPAANKPALMRASMPATEGALADVPLTR